MYSYLKESQKKISNFALTFFSVPIIFKDLFLYNIDMKNIVKKLEQLIPIQLTQSLDAIYIGQFNHLIRRSLIASYDENVIYVMNDQRDEKKIILAILHEFAHVSEDLFGEDIYRDESIKKEFLMKRMWLYKFLKSNNFDIPPIQDFMNIEWDQYFESYIFEELGYNMLLVNTINVFPSPYAIVDLREYYAIGFEKIFSNNSQDILHLKKICPKLYSKIFEIKYQLEQENGE